MTSKIQFKYILKTREGERTVSKTFSRINQNATREEMLAFQEALTVFVPEENSLFKLTEEEIY